jgi:alpha-beta hydrolase superfamily lysophospholipase
MPDDLPPDSLEMYKAGLAWAEENKDKMTEVHTVRDGLNLYGEYYDLGFDRCAVILSGRTESLKYGYYFAIPYSQCGCNILVFDPRAHGKSDGEYNTVGFEESLDDLAWLEYMKERFVIKSFVLHGICIGSAGGILALTGENAPREVEGIVAEGMFPNFGESVKNHMRERKHSTFIAFDLTNMWMKRYTGHSMKNGPIDVIDKLRVPLLMLHSREDIYSTPENAEKLYQKAGSDEKQIVWFPKGRHSMLRITDTERYDNAIKAFLLSLDERKKNSNVL